MVSQYHKHKYLSITVPQAQAPWYHNTSIHCQWKWSGHRQCAEYFLSISLDYDRVENVNGQYITHLIAIQ